MKLDITEKRLTQVSNMNFSVDVLWPPFKLLLLFILSSKRQQQCSNGLTGYYMYVRKTTYKEGIGYIMQTCQHSS